uniref:DOMON domain-containing protein n=1 Tax=Compsopogon caeruleus TaxID=31354 RepID=A0A7S1XEG0_9RHOD
MENGVVSIVFKRPVVGVDAGSYDGDYAVEAGKATFITWALGPVDSGTGYPLFHNIEYPRTDVSIEFGRSPVDHCQESLVSTEESVNGISRPYISGNTTLVARIGPSGGKRGYQAITGRPGWGIAWYMNDILIPVIGLERGTTYTFVTQGGGDEQHPFYITSSSEGGFSQETPAGRLNQTVYAGIGDVVGNSSGIFNWTLLGDGALCEYTGVSEIPANITDFREYLTLLNTSCSTDRDIQSMSKSFEWTPDTSTPDIVYYQCTQHRLLGWKMRVFDAGATNESELVALSDALLMTTLNASGTPAPGGVCFPALARVELDTGATIPMERLKIGDRVRTTSSSFSEVFFFGHRDLEAVHQFLSIETESETGPRTLEMSASHLVFISTASSPKAVAARTLLPGVELISSHGTLERVKSVKTVFRRGLLNPHTLDGRIVVNGFQASCFNSFAPPRWGHALLLLERWAYSLGRSILGDIFFINRPKPFDVLLTPWLRS